LGVTLPLMLLLYHISVDLSIGFAKVFT
jgi:hypothetical protein